MSTFIQIPNRINQLTKKSKLEEIFTYAAIRSQIKNDTYKASLPQSKLAELIGVNERTIRNYIDTIEKSGLIKGTTKKHGTGEYAHNVYQFDYLNKEYFSMNPDLITDESISAKLKGLLILIKSYCFKGTNYLRFNSKSHLAEILHVGKNQLYQYLNELEEKGFIRYIDKVLILSKEYFYLHIKNNVFNQTYEVIYDFCLEQNVVPPYKDVDTNDIGTIAAAFPEPEILLSVLRKRCSQLPSNVSMAYFTQTLRNSHAETRIPIKHEYYFK